LFGSGGNFNSVILEVQLINALKDSDRQRLIEPFYLDKIKIVVFQMKANKIPGVQMVYLRNFMRDFGVLLNQMF
jgi:hypothetical protein